MLVELLKSAFRPINLHDRYSSPVYFSPAFSLLTLGGLIIFQWTTSFLPHGLPIPEWGEWSIFAFMGLGISFIVGVIPYFLVLLYKCRGYRAVQGTVLALVLIFILALWGNPNRDISPAPAFFQTAGIVGTLSLFLWPVIKFMGTPPRSSKEGREKAILHNAVAALLRRGEITEEEAIVANPLRPDAPDLSIRLQYLPAQARWSVKREMEIERSIWRNK